MAKTVAIGVQDYAKLIEGQNFSTCTVEWSKGHSEYP